MGNKKTKENKSNDSAKTPKNVLRTPDGKPFKTMHSWNTSDEYEIELRRVRAASENLSISPRPQADSLFRDYAVKGNSGSYTVELRSLDERINTCTCKDFEKNQLGTCKHIESILLSVGGIYAKSPFYEIYMEHSEYRPALARPKKQCPGASGVVDMFFSRNGRLYDDADVSKLLQAVDSLPEKVRSVIRVSWEVRRYTERMVERKRMAKLREIAEAQLRKNGGATPFLKQRLYDYQQEGMLHLAFKGRAILADDMGLGKTVQAVAASALMREMFAVRHVLVVSPTSLKLEWEEQIRKFTDLPCEAVYGDRPQRLKFYRTTDAFFILMNYEQVLRDAQEIMELLNPEILILDEAQRIKNWTTQTARTLKGMDTPYVFVLTGTPLENRIDDIYSLTEIVDPTIFGSLFRFNRKYYKFDSFGKVCGMQNLDELHAKLSDVMLRRRKTDVSLKLPPRSDRNLFVPMSPEQRKRYDDEEYKLLIIVNLMKRRPLTPEEFQRMQLHLANMRMLCDTCYILDPEVKDSPKLDEVMQVLHQYMESEPGRKIIIFSEWVRMLDLLKERLDDEEIAYVEHTGTIPPKKRRELLRNFKTDSGIRLLLCSEAGGTGLNLQQASVVFNLDLPWNPARLEQRIARSWRNKQEREVDVVNFVTENTIEQKMLSTLKYKSGLADLVLDGTGDKSSFEDSNAREVFLKRLRELLSTPQTIKPKTFAERVRESKLDITRIFSIGGKDGGEVMIGVGSASENEMKTLAGANVNTLVISNEMSEMLKRLAAIGAISINESGMKCLYDANGNDDQEVSDPEAEKRAKAALLVLEKASRPLQMARILESNGFGDEAHDGVWKAAAFIEKAIYTWLYGDAEASSDELNSEAFNKTLDDSKIDAVTRKFLELSHARLNAKEKGLIKQCENSIAAVKSLIGA
ncbi:MAG: DEAD/DEAH box helicase [Victivallales bacterium]|nr:DEAD/DEAH box helicase [Victivallales bacterium]